MNKNDPTPKLRKLAYESGLAYYEIERNDDINALNFWANLIPFCGRFDFH